MTAPQIPLTPTGRRVMAAGMVATAIGEVDALGAVTVVELLDLVSGTILRTVGLADEDSKQILAALWS